MAGHKAMGAHQSAKANTEVWLTPPDLLAKLGGPDAFDLDPCAAIDQPWATARQMFTIEDDGLAQDWRGRVWLNPPYSTAAVVQWLTRLAAHEDGIALIFARTETATFHRQVWEQCDALLFLEGRLHFHVNEDTWFPRKDKPPIFVKRGDATDTNSGAPSVLCAYGPENADILLDSGIPGAFVPLRIRAFTIGFSEPGSWVEEVRKVMERADRPMTVAQLYKCLADSPKARRNENWRAKIRQTLQRGPFAPQGNGVWELDRDAAAEIEGAN